MTRDETAAMLAYLQAAFPSHELDDGQIKVWAQRLTQFDARDVRVAAQRVVDTETYWPSIASVIAATQAAARARIADEGPPRELAEDNGPPLTKEQQLENARKVRAMLATVGKRAR